MHRSKGTASNNSLIGSEEDRWTAVVGRLINQDMKKYFTASVNSWFANAPETLEAYARIIDEPICLSDVRDKLERRWYSNADQVESDVRKVFANCQTFYTAVPSQDGRMLQEKARQLLASFEEGWQAIKTGSRAISPPLEPLPIQELLKFEPQTIYDHERAAQQLMLHYSRLQDMEAKMQARARAEIVAARLQQLHNVESL